VTETDQTDRLRERAIDAATAVFDRALNLMGPNRVFIAEALAAATAVYDADHDQAVQDMMDRSQLAGMTVGPEGATVTAIAAREQAIMFAGMAAQFLGENPDAENYVEQTMHVWDADHTNRYTVVFEFVRPGKPTPHELRRAAESQRDRLRTILGQTISALHVALNHDPTHGREEVADETAGCWEALDQAKAVFEATGAQT
jgi:hypothetical protein